MLLGGEELSDSNMLAHLGIIEQRSNELLQVCLDWHAVGFDPTPNLHGLTLMDCWHSWTVDRSFVCSVAFSLAPPFSTFRRAAS